MGVGIGLTGEYDDAKDDAEDKTGERTAGVLLFVGSNLEDYKMI